MHATATHTGSVMHHGHDKYKYNDEPRLGVHRREDCRRETVSVHRLYPADVRSARRQQAKQATAHDAKRKTRKVKKTDSPWPFVLPSARQVSSNCVAPSCDLGSRMNGRMDEHVAKSMVDARPTLLNVFSRRMEYRRLGS